VRKIFFTSQLLLVGCASPIANLVASRDVATPAGVFSVHFTPGADADQTTVARAIERSAPKLARWGALKEPVAIWLLPTHRDLERASRRWGYDWLRAWAQYDDVLLQSPSSWGANDAALSELLAHELTHCLMYQRAGTPEDWPKKDIPLWFREGMATWTAEQSHRWLSLEDLARVYEEGSDADPIALAEALYQSKSAAVYSAAHYAFTFLVRRYGEGGVERILGAMAAGRLFPDAFRTAIGIDAAAFVAEFRRYVVWRAFRGDGRRLRSAN
jgi:hypothetical protein